MADTREHFWLMFMVLNGIAILLFVAVFVWAWFDIHERLGWVLIAQVPPLLMMAVRKIFR